MKALVLDGDSRAALAVVRSLGIRGIDVTVASEYKNSLAGCSKWCSDRLTYPCPRATLQLFEDWLACELANRPDSVLFAVSDATMSIVGKCRFRLPHLAQQLLPPSKSLEIALDKSSTLDLAQKLRVPIPVSMIFERGEAIGEDIQNLVYPLAIKAARSDLPYRYATTYANDPVELRIILHEVLRESPTVLVQEVIPGEGTAIFALFDNGRPLVTFAHRRIIEKPPWGGVSALCESIPPPPDELGHALGLLESLNWHGPAMVEFKRNADGVAILMEINPRFWGSLELAVRSGLDFPYFAWRLANGEKIENPTVHYCASRWVLGELDSLVTTMFSANHGRSRIADMKAHLCALRYGACFEIERVSDPMPAFYEYAAWLRTSAVRFAARWRGGASRWGKPSVPEA